MGCFLACFGFSNNRNRRKPIHKRHGSYEPLDSPITILSLDTVDSESRHKQKDQLSSKIRKKVSFNLNVQTYEPISTDYHFLLNQENDSKTNLKEKVETLQRSSSSEKSGTGGSSNVNYRYQNCRDYYDEEDDIAFGDSDLDDYEDDSDLIIDDDDDDDDDDCDIEGKRENRDEIVGERANVDKSDYVHSVLKPVENLSQWRAAKAKEAAPAKQKSERKENVPLLQGPTFAGPDCHQSKPLLREVTVNSSLSNWLNSSST